MKFIMGYFWSKADCDRTTQDPSEDGQSKWDTMKDLWNECTKDSLGELVNEFGFPYGVKECANDTYSSKTEGDGPWATGDDLQEIRYDGGWVVISHNSGLGYFAFSWSESNPFE